MDVIIGHRLLITRNNRENDSIDGCSSSRYREPDNSARREFVKALARAIGEASSFAGRSTPREQVSWRSSCNWLHFGSETTKEVSSCTSNGVTVVLKILVSRFVPSRIPSRTERERVFFHRSREKFNVVFYTLHRFYTIESIEYRVLLKLSNILRNENFLLLRVSKSTTIRRRQCSRQSGQVG